MREILKIMNIDFVTSKAFGLNELSIGVAFTLFLSLLFSPGLAAVTCLFGSVIILPLVSNKENDNKTMFGVLPVKRKRVTAARFVYIYCVFCVCEIIGMIIAKISILLSLNRLLPETLMMKLAADNFGSSSYKIYCLIIAVSFIAVSIMFMYAEMMRQIFGREKLGHIIIISVLVLIGIFIAYVLLASFEIIYIEPPQIPATLSGMIFLVLILNAVSAVIGLIFCKITLLKISVREI